MGIVIHIRAVVLFPLDDGEDAGRRLASLDAGRHRRAQDPAVGVVESDLLGLDRHDRHDRLACIARSRRLGGRRGARLSRRGVGGQRRQCGHRRERHDGGRTPAPHRHGGSRRRKSIYHAMSRLKCSSALASIKCQIAILGLTDGYRPCHQFRSYTRSPKNSIHPRLPAFAGRFERVQNIRVHAQADRLFPVFGLRPASRSNSQSKPSHPLFAHQSIPALLRIRPAG